MYFTPIITELYVFPALDSLVSIFNNLPSASFLARENMIRSISVLWGQKRQ